MRHALLALAVSVVMVGGALAGPFEDGLAASDDGDFEAAFLLWRPLAENGDPRAQVAIGFLYETRSGGLQDVIEEARWFRLAADQGDAEGQFNLGRMYANGWGVPRDESEAVRLLRLSADQGSANGQNALGNMYRDGRGVPQDNEEAFQWLLRAADQRHTLTMWQLGRMFEQGIGVERDLVQAYMWYELLASRLAARRVSVEPAIALREHVRDRMTPAQIAEAQRLAREWDSAHPVAQR